MSDQFNPDRARQLAEADRPKQQPEYSAPTHLEVFPTNLGNKPVAEMAKNEADKAYNDILGRLLVHFVKTGATVQNAKIGASDIQS